MTDQRHTSDSDPAESTATNTGHATATNGGVAFAGVVYIHQNLPPAPPPEWPLLVGEPPLLASAFQPRTELVDKIRSARYDNADVVLAEQQTTRLLYGGGGVGKSQLAGWFARHALIHGTTDLVVWINASSPDQIISGYARAAADVKVPRADGTNLTEDARRFLKWLSNTKKSWLIVLDDVTDPDHLKDNWWPSSNPRGWTLATTRLRDNGTLTSNGRRTVAVDVYTPDEATTYLTQRLTDADYPHPLTAIGDLAAALGLLPLALSHAAAYLIEEAEPCTTYLERYNGKRRLAELMPARIDPDAYGKPVAVTLLLALDAADNHDPVGLARPALALAAVLDPAGHPDSMWDTDAVTNYLTQTHGDSAEVSGDQARQVMRLLHRYALITHTPTDGPRAVQIHALTARAMQDTLTDLTSAARAAAYALIEIWPNNNHRSDGLPDALRANTATLHATTGDALWHHRSRSVLYLAGNSLLDAGLHATAITYWTTITAAAARVLGKRHPDTLLARAGLAASYGQAGRTTEAITLQEQVLADSVAILRGWRRGRRRRIMIARANLAALYGQAGRTTEAITLQERVLAASVAIFGDRDPATLTFRANLAASYGQAGRTEKAIVLEEQVLADRVAILGDRDPATLKARANLAASYRQAERTDEAITLGEQVLKKQAAVLGEFHPDTLQTRANLAASYRQAGRTDEAITLQEQVLQERVVSLGDRHPHTLRTQANLAAWYQDTGQTAEAIAMLTTAVAGMTDVLGAEHSDTVQAAAVLKEWTAQDH